MNPDYGLYHLLLGLRGKLGISVELGHRIVFTSTAQK